MSEDYGWWDMDGWDDEEEMRRFECEQKREKN